MTLSLASRGMRANIKNVQRFNLFHKIFRTTSLALGTEAKSLLKCYTFNKLVQKHIVAEHLNKIRDLAKSNCLIEAAFLN